MKRAIILSAVMFLAALSEAVAQGTAFTYQGRLTDGGNSANGFYDIRAGLYTTNTGGTVFAGPVTNPAVIVSNGLFEITLDYSNVFDGTTYWLQIAVRTNNVGGFTILSPRQELTPTPYAIFAEGASAAGLSGTVPPASLSGGYSGVVSFSNPSDSFAGNGSGLANVNAATLNGLAASNFWQLGGNTSSGGSQFLGTLNNQPLDFYADGVRVMRLILRTDAGGVFSNAPNVIGGSAVNLVRTGVVGGTVGGGGGNDTNAVSYPNQVNANFGTVSGGLSNNITSLGSYAAIGGGQGNVANQGYAVLGGGFQNTAVNAFTVVGGGFQNSAGGPVATVGGGAVNVSSSAYSTVGGGANNIASGTSAGYSTVSGGYSNLASDYSAVGGGSQNYASGQYSTVGGGTDNIASNYYATVSGGGANIAGGNSATVSGGVQNVASNNYSTVGGGQFNTATGDSATVAGGGGNFASGSSATVGGGSLNNANATSATVAGGAENYATGTEATVGGGLNNLAGGVGSFIGGGGDDGSVTSGNVVQANAAGIVGGVGNQIPAGSRYAFIGGGASNSASAYGATLGGGFYNTASGFAATLGGGFYNTASGTCAVVGGGGQDGLSISPNLASGGGSVVGGGIANTASGRDSTVSGGILNSATGFTATVPGGSGNSAGGDYSFAAGSGAQASHDGSFVWADHSLGGAFDFGDTAANVFFARCVGGAKFVTSIDPGTGSDLAGVKIAAGGTSWSAICDRNAKKNFQAVDTVGVLNKLATIPIQQWNYKWEANSDTPNLGPMAQDFKAAFYPGRDDKSISTLEFDGVELAAIQGLNQKLEERARAFERQLQRKDTEIQQLQETVSELKNIVSQLAQKKGEK